MIERDGKLVGSRLLAQDFRKPVLDADGKPRVDADGNPVLAPDPRYFQPRPSTATSYNAAGHGVHQPRAEQQGRARHVRGQPRRPTCKLERPLRPRPDRDRVPGRRGHQLGVGRRSAHLARPTPRSRRTASPPCAAPARPRSGADRRQHRRALPRRARRARRQRPRAQPRPRPPRLTMTVTDASDAGRAPRRRAALALAARPRDPGPRARRLAAQARPARAGPQPGDVRRRDRRGHHDRRVADPGLRRRRRSAAATSRRGSRSPSRSGCG